jgi:2-polyprenyl-3-methyl-5-hydroxy-6-metoxy-1,4-benzoquinol methylase/uncharacterized protein YbaR (Trm112 family)
MSNLYNELLRCPECKGGLTLQDTDNKSNSSLKCLCGNEYQIVNGVPIFTSLSAVNVQSTGSLESFNYQYGKEEWIFKYDIERVKRIIDKVFKIKKEDIGSKSVCVVGCGNGCEVSVLSSFSPKYIVGIDLTDSLADAVINNKDNNNVLIVQADALNPPLHQESFDVLYCDGVLPHTQNPKEFLKAILSLIKPEGTAYIRTLIDHENMKSSLHILPRNIFRKFSKRLPSGVWWKLCYVIGALVKVPILGEILSKALFYIDPDNTSIRVTQLTNFRFYGDHKYRHRMPMHEVVEVIKNSCANASINIEGSAIKIDRKTEVKIFNKANS